MAVSKTAMGASPSGVRIPPSPPVIYIVNLYKTSKKSIPIFYAS